MTINLARCAAPVALAMLLALPALAQTPPAPAPGEADYATAEKSAVFDVTPVSGTLKETVHKDQQLVWRARGTSNDPRFQISNMSVAFLRGDTTKEVKMTFSGHVSALGWRPVDEAKVDVIVRTRGGASLYSWSFGVSVRCADANRPVEPLTKELPSDIVANVFANVGAVEIAEHREPNLPRLMVRRCPG